MLVFMKKTRRAVQLKNTAKDLNTLYLKLWWTALVFYWFIWSWKDWLEDWSMWHLQQQMLLSSL